MLFSFIFYVILGCTSKNQKMISIEILFYFGHIFEVIRNVFKIRRELF